MHWRKSVDFSTHLTSYFDTKLAKCSNTRNNNCNFNLFSEKRQKGHAWIFKWLRTLINKTNKIHFSSYHQSFVWTDECILLVALAPFHPAHSIACLSNIHSPFSSNLQSLIHLTNRQPSAQRPQDNRKSVDNKQDPVKLSVRHDFGGKSLFLLWSLTFYWCLYFECNLAQSTSRPRGYRPLMKWFDKVKRSSFLTILWRQGAP